MTINLKNRCLSFLMIIVFLITTVFASVCINAEEDSSLETIANNAIIFNADTGYELYAKNADDYVYCAFLPRLMTCILLMESGINLETQVTITSEMLKNTPEKSSANLEVGNVISLRDLMKCVLVSNSQECAVAIATTVAGTLNNFVAQMNARAAELGATKTTFTNVTGYYTTGTRQLTTARDIAKIITHALSLDYIEDYSNSRMITFSVGKSSRTMFTKNLLIDTNSAYYSKRATGLAISGNQEQGFALASMATNKNMRLVSIAIGNTSFADILTDVANMLTFSVNEYAYRTLVLANAPITEIEVVLGKDRDYITSVAEKTLEVSLPKSIKDEDILHIYNVPDSIEAPILKGQQIGTAEYYYNGTLLGTVNLLAQTDVALDIVGQYTGYISDFFKNPIVWTVFFIILIIIIGYTVGVFIANKRRIREELRKRRDRVKITEKKKAKKK
ncbi:MAG: D-alanyl-D-alanine carboxypeptidase [Clostridia bacterium]|nr:D-alanyl-D-alanine carboxypeptidase [Clostridia bacterium]